MSIVTLKDPIERGLKDTMAIIIVKLFHRSYTQRPDRKGTESKCGWEYPSTYVNTVTLKDPIERGLKGFLSGMLSDILYCCYTQRPDRKGTESSCGVPLHKIVTSVTLKDPIERGLKGHRPQSPPWPRFLSVTLKDPIERGLKETPFVNLKTDSISRYTQRPDRKGTEREIQAMVGDRIYPVLHSKTR